MKYSPDFRPKLRAVDIIPFNWQGKEAFLLRDPLAYSENPLIVPKEMASLLLALDGKHSLRDIQVILTRQLGRLVMLEEIENFLATLEKHLFLETDYFIDKKRKLERNFSQAVVRPSSHAGQAYPREAEELKVFLNQILSLWPKRSDYFPRIIIAPHIDLQAGARTFAAAYQGLSWPKGARVIVLGTGHFLETPFSLAYKDFETPLGLVKYDREFVTELSQRVDGDLRGHEWAHKSEHSIDFQVIFLKYLLEDFWLVPILVANPQGQQQVFKKLVKALRPLIDENIYVVAGVDFCHLGLRYGDPTPASEKEKQKAKEFDFKLLQKVLAFDANGIYEMLERDDYYKVCGFGPLYLLSLIFEGERLSGRILHQEAVDFGEGSIVSLSAAAFFDKK
ncbi:AmmeMemoRadiSam system protein B [Thermodesulfatator autotrophicus]|nr:AmmeMemoRadiSam system protein B [Thermodesulfatator autotrophicus]